MINPDSDVQMTLVGNEGWHETKVDCHGHSANIKTYKAKIGNWDKKNGCASKLRDLKPISWLLWNAPLLQKHCKARTIWVWQKCASHLSQDGTISTRHATINTNRHSCDHLARFSSARRLAASRICSPLSSSKILAFPFHLSMNGQLVAIAGTLLF